MIMAIKLIKKENLEECIALDNHFENTQGETVLYVLVYLDKN